MINLGGILLLVLIGICGYTIKKNVIMGYHCQIADKIHYDVSREINKIN